jgi:tetratricopeptide (TPR) repeat protein
MDSERWKRIDNLLHAALDRPTAEREAFMRQECAGDEALEREVRSLIASDREAGSFLDHPVVERPAEPLEESTVTDLAGGTISHYRILEMLGAGGMGVVYKAYDTKLERPVALKFLPPHLRHNQKLKQRLKEEARAASTLDHPNIVVIHDIDETAGGDLFIAMAFHEGITLRERIEREKPKGMPVAEALGVARQIAAGLARAHERGIFHRDIKPSNVIVAADGVARIIDFGLAKSSEATVTADGSTKGTPLYMSPEQASGKPLDCRTDLWSLGAVLYEMLAGRPPFTGEGNLPVLHAIVHDTPRELREFRPDLPPAVDRIVARALDKDLARRYQTAAEMAGDLSATLDGSGGKTAYGRAARRVHRKAMAVAAAVVLAVAVAGYFYMRRQPKLTDKDTVVLADFENKTGDAVFDGTLRQGLAAELEQSPFLSLVSDEKIQHTLGLMGQPQSARLTPQLAREACVRIGSAAVIAGTISSFGSQYVLGLSAWNCHTGDRLDEEQARAATKEGVLNALGQMARKFRTRIGESLATVEKHDTPLAEATTPSLEALKAYTTAQELFDTTGPGAAIPHLQRAIEIDPNFALAHLGLARMYGSLWEPVRAAQSARKAYDLRNRVSDLERFFIMIPYDLDYAGNLERAEQNAKLWAETYPRDFHPRGFLSWIDQMLGKYEESAENGRQCVALNPSFPPGWNNLAWAYLQLNRLTDAENTIREATEHKVAGEFKVMRYEIAFLRDDRAGMEREAAGSERDPDLGDWIGHAEGCVLAFAGRLQEARKKSRQAVDSVLQATHKREHAATYDAGMAVREAFFGNAREAKQYAAAALEVAKGRDVEYGAAFALGLAGDAARFAGAGERSGEGLRGYLRPIQLPAHAACALGGEPRRLPGRDRGARNRPSV